MESVLVGVVVVAVAACVVFLLFVVAFPCPNPDPIAHLRPFTCASLQEAYLLNLSPWKNLIFGCANPLSVDPARVRKILQLLQLATVGRLTRAVVERIVSGSGVSIDANRMLQCVFPSPWCSRSGGLFPISYTEQMGINREGIFTCTQLVH